MPGTPIIHPEQALQFALLFVRISSILIMIPVLGERTVPLGVKGGLAILISLLLFPVVPMRIPALDSRSESEVLWILIVMCGEALIGIVIGFAAKILFSGIQFAGEMIGIQIGFSVVNIIDPLTSTQVSVISEFQYLIALLIYLAVDAHHTFLLAMVDSYRLAAPFAYSLSGSLVQYILTFSKELFVIAIQISAPVLAVMFFTNVALGIVARTVPQINVFIVGFPLQIAVGLTVLSLMSPLFVRLVQGILSRLAEEAHTLLRLL